MKRSPQPDYLGSFEQLVLLAVARLGDDAYGMTVRRELEARTERTVSLGAVYATLERLEQKGYVSSRPTAGGEERAGRPRRLVRIEPAGSLALRQTLEALDRMRRDIDIDLGGLEPAGVRR